MSRTAVNELHQYPLTEMDPAGQLDAVLRAIKRHAKGIDLKKLTEYLNNEGVICTDIEVNEVILKLIKDGFVITEIRKIRISDSEVTHNSYSEAVDEKVTFYLTTFEGKVRIDFDCGYSGILHLENEDRERIAALEKRQAEIQERTLKLTILAGAIGFFVLLISLLQYLLSVKIQYPLFPCWFC